MKNQRILIGKPGPPRPAKFFPEVGMIFFEVAGGPYGAEPVVRKGQVEFLLDLVGSGDLPGKNGDSVALNGLNGLDG